jgi:hypothetical protein
VATYFDDLVGTNPYRNLERMLNQMTRYIEETSGVTKRWAYFIIPIPEPTDTNLGRPVNERDRQTPSDRTNPRH